MIDLAPLSLSVCSLSIKIALCIWSLCLAGEHNACSIKYTRCALWLSPRRRVAKRYGLKKWRVHCFTAWSTLPASQCVTSSMNTFFKSPVSWLLATLWVTLALWLALFGLPAARDFEGWPALIAPAVINLCALTNVPTDEKTASTAKSIPNKNGTQKQVRNFKQFICLLIPLAPCTSTETSAPGNTR